MEKYVRVLNNKYSIETQPKGSISHAVDDLLSAMRQIPCWDSPGSERRAPPTKAALGAAVVGLLHHMAALPDEGHAAWRFADEDAESGPAEDGHENGQIKDDSQASAQQSGLHGEVEEEPGHEEWPLAASWGSELDHRGPGRVHVVNEGALACELLLALQGVLPAILRLENGHFQTESLCQASLSNLLQPAIQSGVVRAALDAYLPRLAFEATSGPSPDPCLQAFAAAAAQVLREQSAALQSVAESVHLRRKADLQNSIRRVTPGSLRHHLACVGVTAAADDDLTVLEVTVHTRALQAQLETLAQVCGLHGGLGTNSSGLLCGGTQLLDHLHAHLEAANAAAAPLLRRLLLAAYRPYAEHLEQWLFRPEAPRAQRGSAAFCDRLPSDLAGLLPRAAAAQVAPCRLPAFLQPWQKEVVLAGLHLQVLHCMPAPLNQLATGLAEIANAEMAPSRRNSGEESVLRGLNNAEDGDDSPTLLTFKSGQLTKITAAQDAAIMEREEFVATQLAEAAAAKEKQANMTSTRGSGPAGGSQYDCKCASAAHEPAFLGTMRALTAGNPSKPQLTSPMPPPDRSTSIDTASSSSSDTSSDAGSAECSPRGPLHTLNVRMGALPDLGGPQPSALEMGSASSITLGGHRGPRLPKPWLIHTGNSLAHGHMGAGVECDAGSEPDYDSDEEETVPLAAAIEACVVRRVLSQYACTSSACLRCLEQLGLEELLAALERYCFMGAGDWADTLVQLMGTANLSVEPTTPHDLHRMLDTAVLASSAAMDSYSALLSLQPGSRSPVWAQQRSLGLLTVQLGMDVRWPLSVVIGQSAMAQYNEVFGVLLELRMMSFQLQRLWLDCVHQHGAQGAEWVGADTQMRLKELRGFRAAAAQVLNAVQVYMNHQLHSTSLPELLQDIKASRDLVQARTAVFRYLSKASCVCLLHEDMQPAAQPLNQVLQAISDCLAIILPVLRSTDGNPFEAVMSERVWQRMQAPMRAFDEHMRALVSQSSAHGEQGILECVLAHVAINDHWVK